MRLKDQLIDCLETANKIALFIKNICRIEIEKEIKLFQYTLKLEWFTTRCYMSSKCKCVAVNSLVTCYLLSILFITLLLPI